MSKREEIVQRILRILNSENSEKKIAMLSEAMEMIQQGKSDEEIKARLGLE